MPQLDPVALTQDLIRRPSVTPADEGAMDIVQRTLEGLGFACRRMKFGEIENLYARYGTASPNLCFAGHTDVVPVGDAAAWSREAFAADIVDGMLIGRGSVDMKSAVAAFAAAAAQAISAGQVSGSLSFLITGDEEGWRPTAPRWWSRRWPPRARSSTIAWSASRPAPRPSAT